MKKKLGKKRGSVFWLHSREFARPLALPLRPCCCSCCCCPSPACVTPPPRKQKEEKKRAGEETVLYYRIEKIRFSFRRGRSGASGCWLHKKKKRRESVSPLFRVHAAPALCFSRRPQASGTEMQRHAESGPPAGLEIGRNGLGVVRTNEQEQQHQPDTANAEAVVAVARTPTAAASTPRGAADDASDAGTDRDGATQLRKRGTLGTAGEGSGGERGREM